MEDTRAYYLASKLYDGTIDAAERQELDQWIAADPSRDRFLDEVALLLGPLTASVNAPVTRTEADWQSLRMAIGSAAQPTPTPAAAPKVIPMARKAAPGWQRYAIAAAVALLVTVGGFWMLQGNGGNGFNGVGDGLAAEVVAAWWSDRGSGGLVARRQSRRGWGTGSIPG